MKMNLRTRVVAVVTALAATSTLGASIHSADAKGKPDRYTDEGFRQLCFDLGYWPRGTNGCGAELNLGAGPVYFTNYRDLAALEEYCETPATSGRRFWSMYTEIDFGNPDVYGTHVNWVKCETTP